MPPSPTQQQQRQQESTTLPRRSPSRVRFNFKDTFTPLVPAAGPDDDARPTNSSAGPSREGSGMGAGLISDPGTPTLNLTEAAAHIRRTLSLGSLTNLLDLATEAALQSAAGKRSGPPATTMKHGPSSLGPGYVNVGEDGAGSPTITATPGVVSGASTATSSLSPSSSIIYLPAAGSKPTQQRSASAPAAPLTAAEQQARQEQAMREATFEAKRELARQTLRDVREAILRPSGEPPRRPADWERVFVLTMLKSTRS